MWLVRISELGSRDGDNHLPKSSTSSTTVVSPEDVIVREGARIGWAYGPDVGNESGIGNENGSGDEAVLASCDGTKGVGITRCCLPVDEAAEEVGIRGAWLPVDVASGNGAKGVGIQARTSAAFDRATSDDCSGPEAIERSSSNRARSSSWRSYAVFLVSNLRAFTKTLCQTPPRLNWSLFSSRESFNLLMR